MLRFSTDYRYRDRQTKAKYVWLKYQSILRGRRILDVGADECHLKQHLDSNTSYLGIGLGGNPDMEVDLEQGLLPFADNTFDCVLCLDVLEHLDNIHGTFDELCRVTRRYVIISLPNPWSGIWQSLRSGQYQSGQEVKFYGLPLEPPPDRHKWFFSHEEAEQFVKYRAEKNNMQVVQIDYLDSRDNPYFNPISQAVHKILLRPGLKLRSLYINSLWSVLEKNVP